MVVKEGIIFNNDFPACSVEGESVLYADDDTDNVRDKNPVELIQKIQREAARSVSWVEDNKMMCAGDKTKLLIIGTRQLKDARLKNVNTDLEVNVCGNTVGESRSEKLLGLNSEVNSDLNWKEYLYGEKWTLQGNSPGLLPQLSKRVGLLKKIIHLLPAKRFQMISNGLFNCLFSEMSGDLIVKMKNQEEASPFPKKTTENCKFCRTGSAGSKLDTTTMFPPPNSCKTVMIFLYIS